MNDKHNTTIILTGFLLVVILFVMVYLSIKAGAVDIISKTRSPIHHHNAWVCVADSGANTSKALEPNADDVEWLAIAIFREAGSDWISNETRYMVGDVILTHVIDDRFPDNLYDVLTEKGKYGRFYWDGIHWPSTAFNSGNKHAAERAREIAYNLLTDTRHSELYGKGYIYQDCRVQGTDNVWSDGICFGR